MSWTDERVELLKKMWLEGLSASQIANELAHGITRNAVIGKVHRLGLSGRVKSPCPGAGAPPRQDASETKTTAGRPRPSSMAISPSPPNSAPPRRQRRAAPRRTWSSRCPSA